MSLEASDAKLKELLAQHETKQQEQALHETNLATLKKTIAAQSIDEQAFTTMEQKLFQGKEVYQQMIAQGNFARQELTNLEHKEKLSHDDENPCCPLCEQNLSATRKRFLKTKFAEQKEALGHQIAQLTKDIQILKASLLAEHTVFEKQKTLREQNIALTTQYTELEKQSATYTAHIAALEQQSKLTQTAQAQLTIDVLQAKNELIHEQKNSLQALENNTERATLRQACATLETSVTQLYYNEEQHKAAMNKLATLEQELLRWSRLQGQKALQAERQKQIAGLYVKNVNSSSNKHTSSSKKKNRMRPSLTKRRPY